MNDVQGVVLTGVYGVGKSSVIEEMANMLEQSDIGYGAIDVDWLWWFDVPGISDEKSQKVLFANLKLVVANYLDAGVNRFLLAWSIRNQRDLDALKEAIPFPLKIVALTASLNVIKERLSSDVTTERCQDIRNTELWLQHGLDSNIHEAEIANDRSIRAVALEVLDILKWDCNYTHNKRMQSDATEPRR